MFSDLLREFDRPNAPGISAMVIRAGKPVFARSCGLADLDHQSPCTNRTNFRLASVTKQFTAMAILILADRGRLSLDECLADLFPGFPAYGRAVTIRHLLTHTSGLIDYERIMPKNLKLALNDLDVLRLLLRQRRTYFPPGARFRYSNSGYALLALAVEARSDQTFSAFLRRNIFEPLGMRQTVAYQEGLAQIANRAYGYTKTQRGYEQTDQSLTSSVLGDGGIYSSVADLFKWDQALEREGLMRGKWLGMAFAPSIATPLPNTAYGMGWYITPFKDTVQIWHSGNSVGFTSRITRFPQERLTLILLANRSRARLGGLTRRIAQRCLSR